MVDQLGPIIFELPPDALDKPTAHILMSMWPAWLTESANFLYFLIERDSQNASGIKDPARLAKLRGFLAVVQDKAKKWRADTTEPDAELVLNRLEDAASRARAAAV